MFIGLLLSLLAHKASMGDTTDRAVGLPWLHWTWRRLHILWNKSFCITGSFIYYLYSLRIWQIQRTVQVRFQGLMVLVSAISLAHHILYHRYVWYSSNTCYCLIDLEWLTRGKYTANMKETLISIQLPQCDWCHIRTHLPLTTFVESTIVWNGGRTRSYSFHNRPPVPFCTSCAACGNHSLLRHAISFIYGIMMYECEGGFRGSLTVAPVALMQPLPIWIYRTWYRTRTYPIYCTQDL